MLADEANEIFDGAVTRVVDGGILLACGVQFESWESTDLVGYVIGGSIAFRNDDFVRVGCIEGSELFILGSKVLAVSALSTKLDHRLEMRENLPKEHRIR